MSIELDEFISNQESSSSFEKESIRKAITPPMKKIRETKKEHGTMINENEEMMHDKVQLQLTDHDIDAGLVKADMPETYLREKYIISENFPKLRLVSSTGQLSNKIYVVLEGINHETNEAGLYILDQHAASERINKEKILSALQTSKISKQQFISPLKIEVSPGEKFFLQENLEEIKKIGFSFDHFGGNTFILREIPTIMGKIPDVEIMKEIIGDITEIGKDKSFSEAKEEIINYIACHKSIRGGDDLTLKDIRNLLIELAACKDSFHCAHGRPTMRFISFKELDKIFKRIP